VNGIRYTPALTLPWESASEEDRLYRRVLGSGLTALLVLSITLPLLPLQEIIAKVHDEPPSLTRVKLEKKVLEREALPKPKPKSRPVPVKPRSKKEIVEVEPKPVPKPKNQPTAEENLARARDQAAASGVLAFQDDLQSLRDTVNVDTLSSTQTSRGAENAAQVQRNLVTQNSPANSGGIQTASLSTDTGGAALSGRQTTAVTSSIGGGAARTGKQSGNGTRSTGGRSDDAIRRVMDENKGAIFALYNRALRRDPLLEGKVVFEMVIDPSGQITELNLLSSDLVNAELTRRILSRIHLIRFGEDDVLRTRVNYSFDFLPYT